MGNDEKKPSWLYKHPMEFVGKTVTSQFLSQVLSDMAEVPSSLTGTKIGSDLPNPPYSIPRPDNIIQLSDDSYLILEFQSTFRFQDLIRFLKYGVFLVDNSWQRDKIIRPVRIVVFYPANVKRPTATFSVNGSINISLEHVSLRDKIDGVSLVNGLKTRLDNYPNLQGEPLLTSEEQLSLYLAPFGRVSVQKNQFWEDYLAVGAQLSEIIDDPNILATMLVALPKSETRSRFEKEFINMYPEYDNYLDYLSGGQISQAQKVIAAKDATIEAKDVELEAKDATIEAKDVELEAKDATIEAKDATIKAFQIKLRSNVLKLRAKGKSLKEISDTLSISQKEVKEIIKNNGKP